MMIHKTKGIVLNQIKYGETSLIVQVYTEKFGRQSYMVKGGRSKRSSIKSNLFRPFFLLEMDVYHREGKNIQSIKEVRLCENLNNLVFDVYKSTLVLFLTEVCSKVFREEERNQELFIFLYNSIRYLDLTEESIERFHLYFLSKLTRFLGFYPQLNWSEEKAFFDLDNGFFVDEDRIHAHCIEKDIQEGILKTGFRLPPQRIIAQYLNINHSTVTRAYKGCEDKGLIKGIIGKGTFVSSTAGIPEEILSHSSNSFIDMGLTLPLYVAMFQKADRLLVDQYTYTGLKSLAKLLGIILVPVASDSKGIDLKDLERSCRRESQSQGDLSDFRLP